jgi:copper chaperone
MKTIAIKGMSCMHCVQSVTKALSAVDGVTAVNVSLDKGQATFEESKPVDPQAVKEAVNRIGFEAGEIR